MARAARRACFATCVVWSRIAYAVEVVDIDVRDVGELDLTTLLDKYVSQGVPVKLRPEVATTWLGALSPLLAPANYSRPRAVDSAMAAAAMSLPALIPIDGVHCGPPSTIYAAPAAGYRQPAHVDELCTPSWALGLSGAKEWTFHFDLREATPRGDVSVEVAAFEEDDIFDLFESDRRYRTTLRPGELLLYAVWLPHAITTLEDQTQTLHGTWQYAELTQANEVGGTASSLPPRVAASCAQKAAKRRERERAKDEV